MKFVRCDICDKTVDLLEAEEGWLLSAENEDLCPAPDSYTHLTLPPIYSV